jgi:hypothetical protein
MCCKITFFISCNFPCFVVGGPESATFLLLNRPDILKEHLWRCNIAVIDFMNCIIHFGCFGPKQPFKVNQTPYVWHCVLVLNFTVIPEFLGSIFCDYKCCTEILHTKMFCQTLLLSVAV